MRPMNRIGHFATGMSVVRQFILVFIIAATVVPRPVCAQEPLFSAQAWTRDGFATQRFQIQGTESRNNPLRRKLKTPYTDTELFVRFRIRYAAESIDRPGEGDGEFLVLWLDSVEGNQGSTHSAGVPNVGIHVAGDRNSFMVRYGPATEKYATGLVGDRDYLVIARLWKSVPGNKEPFDQLDLWVDPKPQADDVPLTSTTSPKAPAAIHWIGFSTGRKTETDDRIEVWDIGLERSWEAIMGLPARPKHESPPAPPRPRTVNFVKHVLPVLRSRCFECHAGEDAEEGIRLDVLDEVLNRTTPGHADQSRLMQLVTAGKMPPEGDRLTDADVSTLRAWIDEGLEWDESLLPTPRPTSDHWAFQPIRRPAIPKVRNQQWVRTPVDAFIARRHEQTGVQPAKPADAATLRRRLFLDLTGMPTPAPLINASDEEPATIIESLLASRQFGERWARHWLDVARWAESNGHQHNRNRPHAWRYRDWLIDAFTTDLPFDQFVRMQLAGDEQEPYSDANIVATGFLAAARYSGNELDKRIQRHDILSDITNTTAKAFLGLTLECAQCHTHKFDPISIRDYYRFQAFFSQGQPGNIVLSADSAEPQGLVDERWQIFDDVHNRLVAVKRRQGYPEPVYVIPKSVVHGMRGPEKQKFNELTERVDDLPQTWGFYSPVTAAHQLTVAPHEMRWPLPRDPNVLRDVKTRLLIRGDVNTPGPEVRPGWPLVFGRMAAERTDRPRSALADWMTGSDQPLTARVWVNRIWQWHFGRGLVETPGDFGTQGTPPSHPQLLDFLAAELMENGRSTRHIHRLILNSSTYCQSHEFSDASAGIDPDNRLLWRWQPRRLEAEAVRDSMLAVSGLLDSASGGPGAAATSLRRSIYLRQRRDNLPHQQELFDGADAVTSCSVRRVSTNALQPLWLLNSDFAQRAANAFAARAKSPTGAIRLAFGREPTVKESDLLNKVTHDHGLPSACLAILNSSEFLYIP